MSEKKPNVNSASEKELQKVEKQFEAYSEDIEKMTMDRMNSAPKKETEPQTKISSDEISKSNDIYLKPHKTIGCRDKFNENYREQYNFDKEYVQFIAENKEIIGETIDLWTRPYGGMPAEEWKVPVNRPVWGPRYLAEQIKRCCYHRFTMRDSAIIGSDKYGEYTGSMVVDNTIQRLDALPVSNKKSIFMGSKGF